MVDDLVGLVEGRVTAGGTGPAPRGGNGKKVVKVKHIGTTPDYSTKASRVKMLPASEVIPLDESDDF